MATSTYVVGSRDPSYQTVRLEEYSFAYREIAEKLFNRVRALAQASRLKHHDGSYSVYGARSMATLAKIIIFEDGLGKRNGDWPDLQDGVYVLLRARELEGRSGTGPAWRPQCANDAVQTSYTELSIRYTWGRNLLLLVAVSRAPSERRDKSNPLAVLRISAEKVLISLLIICILDSGFAGKQTNICRFALAREV